MDISFVDSLGTYRNKNMVGSTYLFDHLSYHVSIDYGDIFANKTWEICGKDSVNTIMWSVSTSLKFNDW